MCTGDGCPDTSLKMGQDEALRLVMTWSCNRELGKKVSLAERKLSVVERDSCIRLSSFSRGTLRNRWLLEVLPPMRRWCTAEFTKRKIPPLCSLSRRPSSTQKQSDTASLLPTSTLTRTRTPHAGTCARRRSCCSRPLFEKLP
jgi:hypothetical protein